METILQITAKIDQIYGVTDRRIHGVDDYFYYHRKYLLRYIDDIEAGVDSNYNLNVALSWFLSLSNRLSIDIDQLTWRRYSYKCPFCMNIPCSCGKNGDKKALKTGRPASGKPLTLPDWQLMIKKIYPADDHKMILAKILSASDKLHFSYRKFHKELSKTHFKDVEINFVDYFVLLIRAYNSNGRDLALELSKYYENGCWTCRKIPCECLYTE